MAQHVEISNVWGRSVFSREWHDSCESNRGGAAIAPLRIALTSQKVGKMKITTHMAALALLATVASVGCVQGAEGEELGRRASPMTATPVPPQTILPLTTSYTNPMDPNETYVAPSLVNELPDDARLDFGNGNSDFALFSNPGSLNIQKMKGRDYWMMANLYSMNVHKGNHGLLMIDAAGHGGPAEFGAIVGGLRAIGEWDQPGGKKLPLKTVMYSHPHSDHVGSALQLWLIAQLKKVFPTPQDIDPSHPLIQGLLAEFQLQALPPIPIEAWEIVHPNLKIVSTIWAKREIVDEGINVPVPNKVLWKRNAVYRFEGRKFRVVTPVERAAHTAADSYIITPDGMLMTVDIVQAGRLPFIRTSVAQDLGGYLKFLRHLKWEGDQGNYYAANWGHFNIGYARDVDLLLDYFELTFEKWWEVILINNPALYVMPGAGDNASLWLENLFDGVAEQLFYKVEPSFRTVPHIEVARGGMANVHEYMFLNYLNSSDPRIFQTLGMCGLIDQNGNPQPPAPNYPDNCAPGAFDPLPLPNMDPLPRPNWWW